jgi:phage major head subunit gpT-like protein
MPGIAFNVQEMRAVARNVRGIYYDAMKSSTGNPVLGAIFFVIQSNALIEKFVMLRGAPKMRHWVGDRQASSLMAQSFQIEKKDWESTITISRDDLQFDRLGLIRPQIAELARAYPIHLLDYVIDLLPNGFTRLGYDGQYFFDTDHDNSGGDTFTNKFTYPLDHNSAYLIMQNATKLRDSDSGEFLDVSYDSICYPQNLQSKVDLVFNTQTVAVTVAGGTTVQLPNPMYGKIAKDKQYPVRQFGDGTFYFFFDSSKSIKPLMMQVVQGPALESFESGHDWPMFMRREAVFGVDSQDNASYMFWELIAGSTGAGGAAPSQGLFQAVS